MAATPWVSDQTRLGVADAWEATFFGDCEDDALAGLEWLVTELGWPRAAFGIMIRRATPERVAHAILCVWIERPGTAGFADPWCLDPLADGVQHRDELAGTWYRA